MRTVATDDGNRAGGGSVTLARKKKEDGDDNGGMDAGHGKVDTFLRRRRTKASSTRKSCSGVLG